MAQSHSIPAFDPSRWNYTRSSATRVLLGALAAVTACNGGGGSADSDGGDSGEDTIGSTSTAAEQTTGVGSTSIDEPGTSGDATTSTGDGSSGDDGSSSGGDTGEVLPACAELELISAGELPCDYETYGCPMPYDADLADDGSVYLLTWHGDPDNVSHMRLRKVSPEGDTGWWFDFTENDVNLQSFVQDPDGLIHLAGASYVDDHRFATIQTFDPAQQIPVGEQVHLAAPMDIGGWFDDIERAPDGSLFASGGFGGYAPQVAKFDPGTNEFSWTFQDETDHGQFGALNATPSNDLLALRLEPINPDLVDSVVYRFGPDGQPEQLHDFGPIAARAAVVFADGRMRVATESGGLVEFSADFTPVWDDGDVLDNAFQVNRSSDGTDATVTFGEVGAGYRVLWQNADASACATFDLDELEGSGLYRPHVVARGQDVFVITHYDRYDEIAQTWISHTPWWRLRRAP